MLIYDGELSSDILARIDQSLSPLLRQHILDIIESAPTSRFYAQVKEDLPNLVIYCIENNPLEAYTLCHLFLTDRLGLDYEYQGMSLMHVNSFQQIANAYF